MIPNDGIRIVVANEPRSYREALSGVLTLERPRDVVLEADPGAMPSIAGALVICSELQPEIAEAAAGWVLVRPDGDAVDSSAAEVEAMVLRPGLQTVLDAVTAVAAGLVQLR